MATNPVFPAARLERSEAAPKASFGLAIVALLLALVLGFSAVDIQRERASAGDPAVSAEAAAPVLDGRGKWGGYM